MDDLFDQLKSTAGPTKTHSSPAKPSTNTTKLNNPTKSSPNNKYDTGFGNFDKKHNSNSASIRRESLPSPPTFVDNGGVTKKSKSKKARSLSPPKYGGANATIKSLKIKLERKKVEEFISRPFAEHANNIKVKYDKNKEASKQAKKTTPTKAQQKQFEPLKENKTKAQIIKEFNIKPCKVRIRRDNLEQLTIEFKNKIDGKLKGIKRPTTNSFSDEPPAKKGKLSTPLDSKTTKPKNNFFIKLTSNQSSKMDKKLKNIKVSSSPPSTNSSSSSVAHHNKIRNSKSSTSITTPTKFSRSQLIGSFGKRFFNVQVKIERCAHPLMLTFESNDRARRLQAKRNKSKNLSVSFREQVEIFGGSSDSDDSCDEDFCAVPNRNNRNKNNSSNQSLTGPLTPVVMPARLKKVENGKVVDDIELDPSLFVDPKSLSSSTPFSPLRKKRDHKSYSPLKDECSSSPRKEQLKLANEKIPPSGLRRLNIDEEDDEDDDCEYIVPIELPQRRTSRTSSNGSLDDIISSTIPLEDSTTDFSTFLNNDIYQSVGNINLNFGADNKDDNNTNSLDMQKSNPNSAQEINHESNSNDSFKSAKDDIVEKDNEQIDGAANNDDNQLPALTLSPSPKKEEEPLKANGNCSAAQTIEKKQNTEGKSKLINNIDAMDDISMNLFTEDSQTNDDNQTKSIVDSLINETIEKLTKDIDESGADKH